MWREREREEDTSDDNNDGSAEVRGEKEDDSRQKILEVMSEDVHKYWTSTVD